MDKSQDQDAAPRVNLTAVAIAVVLCVALLLGFALWLFKTDVEPLRVLDKSVFITTNTAHLYRHGQFHSVIQPWTLVQNKGDLPGGWARVLVNHEEYDLGRSHMMQAEACRSKLTRENARLQAQLEKMNRSLISFFADGTTSESRSEKEGSSQLKKNIEVAEKQIAKNLEIIATIDHGAELFPAKDT